MAIERRLAFYSGQRVDIPHIRALESAVSHDFDMLLRGLFTGLGKPYLVRGFRIKIPNSAINASSLQIEVADSVILHSSATESGTLLQTSTSQPDETLDAQNAKVIGSFQSNALNYVSLDYRRTTDVNTVDQTAGWSPSQQLEFQRAVPIGRILDYRFIISTSGFGTNLPLYIVKTTNTGAVEYITKGVTDLFRLGTGGANPDPSHSYDFGNLVNPQAGANPRREWVGNTPGANVLTVEPGANPLAFDFGDFAIKNLKEWMDGVMTRFKEITNSQYWYFGSGLPGGDELNLSDLYFDSIGSVLTGAGDLSYNLVLESIIPTLGAYQSSFTDNTALPGDLYVEGVDSSTKATLTSFSAGRLIINSMTSAAFTYGEALRLRRRFRPLANKWRLSDYNRNSSRYGTLGRITSSVAALPNNIASWSFSNLSGATSTVGWTVVTVNTSAPHGLNVGEWARIDGLLAAGSQAPNGVHRILASPTTSQFIFIANVPQSGAATVSGTNGAVVDTQDRHPFTPSITISAVAPDVGTQIALTCTNHAYKAPQSLTADLSIGSNIIDNISSMTDLRLGQTVYHANLPGGSARILRIDTTAGEIEVSANASASASSSTIAVRESIFVTGLHSTLLTDNQVSGEFEIMGLGIANELLIDLGAPYGTMSADADAAAEQMFFQSLTTITEATQIEYNVINVASFALAGDKLQFFVGPDTLPVLANASGPYMIDSMVALSEVIDPVRVNTITNDGAGNLTVVTYLAHEQVTGGPVDFTIFGNSQLSDFIRSYKNVTLNVIDPTTFIIQGTGLIDLNVYTNPGNDNTFVKFADNPYAGPVQWSSDIIVKGIIGDLSFTVPQTATVDTSDPDVSPTANQFNINGVTGTAYMQDGEVLFVKLERNKPISNNTVFSTAGGNSTIVTAGIMTDQDGDPLVIGDFIKFADEADSYWLKIKTINPTAVTLETDRGQEPTVAQRPAKTGKMLYTKGVYDKVYVKKHATVDASASTYWLGVRRDNDGARAKVYFRNLEVEAGEVRQINDNQTTNLLQYTGAMNESAVNPNYSVSDTSGDYQYLTQLTVESVDNLTRMVTFVDDPERGFQNGDHVSYFDGSQYYYFTVKNPLSSRTVIMEQDTSILAALQTVSYYRENQTIEDTDNLTLAHRKQDRQVGHHDTTLKRPVYDESIYIQQINLSGAGTVRSGSYMYKGPITNPTALAWVLHGNVAVSETIETSSISMPGGHVSVGSNAVLVNVVFGSFLHGDGIFQNGASTGRTVNNSGNPPFTAPPVFGDTSGGGVEIVLPPNRRTQVSSLSGIVVYGNHSLYKSSLDQALSGEELLIIVNDGVREARYDYDETFGGPKAKVQLRRTTPPNTRMRFRLLASYGSALAAKSADVSLQSAYNAGSTILTGAGRPVEITSDDVTAGTAGAIIRGSLKINGGASQLGGIFNELGDKSFLIGKETDKPKEVWTGLQAIKTHSSHVGSANQTKTAAQVVTGDTGTIITDSAITLSDNYAYRVKINATARRSDGPLGIASFTMEGTFYRSGGGALAAGSPISTVNGADGGGVSYGLAFGLSGNDVVAVAFGESGATVQWVLTVEWQAVGVA
jgi:hypothetical protein